jgi:hypothetical protein
MIHQSKNLAELLLVRRLSLLVQREGMFLAVLFTPPPPTFKSLVGSYYYYVICIQQKVNVFMIFLHVI